MKHFLSFVVFLLIFKFVGAGNVQIYFWFETPSSKSYKNLYLDVTINQNETGIIYLDKTGEINLETREKHTIEILDGKQLLTKLEVDATSDSLFYYKLKISGSYGARKIEVEPIDRIKGGLRIVQLKRYELTNFGSSRKEDTRVARDGNNAEDLDPSKFGSGFLISSEGYIITNYHVVEDAKKIIVRGINGSYETKYEAEIVSKDVHNDLVVLVLKDKTITFATPPYPLRLNTANTGEDIFILGYPLITTLGTEVKLTTGVISAKSGYGGNASSYQISAPAQPGNSGGPLYDKDGNLIGVVNAKVNNTENITYAIKAVYLQALLGMLPKEPLLSTTNTLKDKSLSEKIMDISSFVYVIEIW